MRKLRLHCRKAAYYAFNLGLNFFDDARFAEDAYLGGLLHDIGKFVFADASSGFYADGDVHDPVFEDVRAGLNHAEIGALLAEKWNFPVHLAAAVRFHHTPDLAPEAYRTLADTVHLADVFCGMEAGTAVFEQADSSSLARLGITKKPQAEELVRTFSSGFKQQQT
jgi:HD-like signal output (HDOD) protein